MRLSRPQNRMDEEKLAAFPSASVLPFQRESASDTDRILATVGRSRTHLATALRNGTVDILIVPGEVPLPDNNVRALWSERILIALTETHPLSARDLLKSKLVSPEGRPNVERHDVSRRSSRALSV